MQLKKAIPMHSGMRWIAVILLAPIVSGGLGCSKEPDAPPLTTARSPAVKASAPAGAAKQAEPERQVYAKTTTNPPAAAATPPEAVAEGASQGSGRPNRSNPGRVPEVLMTVGHDALCRVRVDDPMPAIELPDLEGQQRALADLYGKRLTVVCFWKDDRALARAELADLGSDVVSPYQERGVAVVGVAVGMPPDRVRQRVTDDGIAFPNLVDADGSGFAQIGEQKLPRTYLLDHTGKILWFDIEYSRSTRRELIAAIGAMLGDQ
jgi:peroxiredoxin